VVPFASEVIAPIKTKKKSNLCPSLKCFIGWIHKSTTAYETTTRTSYAWTPGWARRWLESWRGVATWRWLLVRIIQWTSRHESTSCPITATFEVGAREKSLRKGNRKPSIFLSFTRALQD
jgi:hypothetical protein